MSKFCSNCGNELKDGVSFCDKCGNSVDGNNNTGRNSGVIVNRNIILAVILSIVTCGIYAFYWICVMNDDANAINGDNNDTSGVMVVLFSILTCGIYLIYWNYKMGKKLCEAGSKKGISITDNSIAYLLLSLFGFSIVSYCLIQNDLNKFSNNV